MFRKFGMNNLYGSAKMKEEHNTFEVHLQRLYIKDMQVTPVLVGEISKEKVETECIFKELLAKEYQVISE